MRRQAGRGGLQCRPMPTDPPTIDEQIAILNRRCDRIVPEAELRAKLRRSAETGRPLRVKMGMDPTSPDVHLGHAVPLMVIRQFQDWGHRAVLIIGDYTARVGDPSGADVTRPMLTGGQIDANAATYVEQVGRILRTDDEHLEVRRNSEWLGKMDLIDLIGLAAQKTVAQMLERDSFADRYAKGTDIRLHEFLYPLLQGYDSVAVGADVEMGGNDQLFNNLVGRELQEKSGKEKQVVIVTPLLVGTDGSAKMSKSKGNYVGLTDPAGGAGGIFGKVMSLPDGVMPLYYTLLTDLPESDFGPLVADRPRDAKVRLAKIIAARFHDQAAADAAESDFTKATHGGVPDEMPEIDVGPGPHGIVALLVRAGFVKSNGEAMRKIKEGGVKLDGERVDRP